jgi:hypothetical protein
MSDYGVYAIEIGGAPKRVYVGQSWHSPEERLTQHLAGGRGAAKVFKRGATGKLRPALYKHLPRVPTREQAEALEHALAVSLRKRGFVVDEGYRP